MSAAAALVTLSAAVAAAQTTGNGRLTNQGVVRASALVDSVFIDRTLKQARIEAGDWASYLLARLGGQIPDSLGLVVQIDSAGIQVRGRLQDVPPEARGLLGPLAAMVDSSTVIVAYVTLQRTGREGARFWLKGISVNGFALPEFVLAPMMARVGRQYPDLTESGRDLYVQVPADGTISLGRNVVVIAVTPGPAPTSPPAPPSGPPIGP